MAVFSIAHLGKPRTKPPYTWRMTNKLLALAFAALVAGCGNSSNNNGTDDMGSGGGGGGGGGGMGGGDMAGVVPCICPSGFTCDSAGVCVGGNNMAIGIDVK